MKLYLAGPEVFLDDAREIGRRKVALCAQYGFEGLFPLDNDVPPDTGFASRQIFEGNMAMIHACEAIIANLSPFRGVSADPGTAFEVGAGFALGKFIVGYSTAPENLKARASAAIGVRDGTLLADGMNVEDFDLFDNLMLAEAVAASGTPVFRPDVPPADPWRDMGLFEVCLGALANARADGRLRPSKA